MEVSQAISHARDVRNRLRFPVNARPDLGIDLKRKPEPVVVLVASPTQAAAPVPADNSLDSLAFGPVVLPGQIEHVLPTCAEIITATAKYFGLAKVEMLSARRQAELSFARHVAMYLCSTMTLRSLPFIGRALGDRDHTTALAGIRSMQGKILAGDQAAIKAVDTLTAQLGGR